MRVSAANRTVSAGMVHAWFGSMLPSGCVMKEKTDTSDMIALAAVVRANMPVRASTVFGILGDMFCVLCLVSVSSLAN